MDRRLPGLALAALGALSALKPLRESDLYWHLALGRAVWRARSRTVPEPIALPPLGAVRHVPEWLWDVVTYGLWQLGGAPALTALVALCGAAVGWFAWRTIDRDDPSGAPEASSLVVAALALPVLFFRLRERPESLVTALVLASLVLLRRMARAPARLGVDAVLLVVVGLVWAQVHSTAVLLPAMAAVTFAPSLRSRASMAALGRATPLALGLLALTPFTGAFGVGLLGQLRAHTGGDAVAHIRDMVPTTWAHLNVATNPIARSFLALLVVGAAGSLAEGRLRVRALGHAALGVAVAAAAGRGLVLGGVLLLPFAASGGRSLWRRFVPSSAGWARAAAAVAAALTAATGATLHARQGPWGEVGTPKLLFPLPAATVLRELPRGAAVYASFGASGPLGWALDGQARTFVDSRTPMHFDDTQYALSRDLSRAAAPGLAFARYDLRAVVVERAAGLCAWTRSAPGWRPVAVVGAWAVFARDGELPRWPALQGIDPCGAAAVRHGRCVEAVAELGAHERWLPGEEAALLRAELAAACPGALVPPASLPAVPGSGEARALVLRLHARDAVRRGRHEEAVRHAMALLEEGHGEAVSLVVGPLAQAGRRDLAREVMRAAVAELDDGASADVRVELATLCAQTGDAEGARFHGLRAAAQGSARAGPVLRWLMRRHPDAAVRADAAAWERVVRAAAERAP